MSASGPDSAVPVLLLEAEGYRIGVAPTRGASLTQVDWRHPDGGWRPVFRPTPNAVLADPDGSINAFASFVMAPFVNRLDGAAFTFEGEHYAVPLNRPEQDCAIHGLARDRAWGVTEQTASSLALEAVTAPDTAPFAFAITQRIAIAGGEARFALEIENIGMRAMPFGIGMHPWLPRHADSLLTAPATATFRMDDRDMPAAAIPAEGPAGFNEPTATAERQGMDQPFALWEGEARLAHPSQGYAVRLQGEGALAGGLHVYVPRGEDVLCLEPVSHVPDVLNRPAFAPYGAMARLAPGERLAGSMRLAAEAI